jgi:UDP-glucose 4-epimerase
VGVKKKILVVGGCGYIGSHMVKRLLEVEHDVTVLDNLSTGFRDSLLGGRLVEGDFGSRAVLDELFGNSDFDGVLHFASLILVGESVIDPARYYRCNVSKTLTLLEAMKDYKVQHLIYSSSAAVFGEPQYSPIDENHPRNPINPYGMTKHIVEIMLKDFARAYGLNSVALRYFNAAGADPQARLGERHDPETHLIPLALRAVSGARSELQLFGQDYDTPDGTCIRDYIHVDDLSDAHLLALEYLWGGGDTTAFNLGNGDGFSVKQVIDVVEKVTGTSLPIVFAPRRAGDPARLVADSSRARAILGWKPQYNDLRQIVGHAWQWEQRIETHGLN